MGSEQATSTQQKFPAAKELVLSIMVRLWAPKTENPGLLCASSHHNCDYLPIVNAKHSWDNATRIALDLGKESLMGNSIKFIQAALWTTNAVLLGCIYIVDRNLKSEKKRYEDLPPNTIRVDLSGKPLELSYQKKMIPEFSIYQV